MVAFEIITVALLLVVGIALLIGNSRAEKFLKHEEETLGAHEEKNIETSHTTRVS
ncbi:hypothetical protein [Alicyclobacillus fodiniaquatilis]|jgi:hypothetical protein|uniref:Uncharacterized protein n=1 Tax=Alicyclobacillus fodiniaquatilis TaxID=1661150 RepID=A0ABW4JED4_9BACL